MVIVNAGVGAEFGKLDRALEYHELLFTDFEAWLKAVNDPGAELCDIALSVVPDVVVAGGGAIKRKAGEVIAKVTESSKVLDVRWTDLGEVLDDMEISHDAGNLFETGDFTSPGRKYSIIPESTGDVTRQLSAELSSTTGNGKAWALCGETRTIFVFR